MGKIKATSQELFFDDFNDGEDSGWTRLHLAGPNTLQKWNVTNFEYGMTINSASTLAHSLAGDGEWTDYLFEFDMHPIQGADRNFIFKVRETFPGSEVYQYYQVHASGNSIGITKHAPSDPNSPFSFPPVFYNIVNGNLYHWKTELIDNKIKISIFDYVSQQETILFDLVDPSMPITNGKIGLRIGTGSIFPVQIYFDNIKVTDLAPVPTPTSTPTPTPTPIPTPTPPYLDVIHYSQRNPLWKDDTYDHTSSTMNNLACAVTSSAMILNYHQFSNSPTGDVTSPATLNNYLIDRGGYTKKGGLIWSYITKYAKESQEAGFADPSLKLLEFTYPNYSPEGLQDKIAQNNPSILKTQLSGEDTPTASDDSYHFIVAKGVVLPTTYINDPWDLTDIGSTLPDKYPNKPITKIAQFTKSHTDLSYIWVYHYNPLVNLIVDSNGLKTGTDQANQIFSQIPDAQYFSEGTLASLTPEPVPTNQHVQLFLLPKPTNDQYLLTFSSQSFQKDSPEIYLFDKDANDTKYFLNTTNLPNYTQTIELDFSTTPTIQQIATFSSLKELILATYESGWIGNVNTKDQLYRFVEVAESVYPKEPESGIDIVNAFLTHLHNTHKQTKINDSAYSLLSIETNLLLNQL